MEEEDVLRGRTADVLRCRVAQLSASIKIPQAVRRGLGTHRDTNALFNSALQAGRGKNTKNEYMKPRKLNERTDLKENRSL